MTEQLDRTGTAAITAPAVSVRGLTARLGGRNVLKNIDLDVHYHSVLALVGPNGAGKSTLLAALAGDASVVAGDVVIDGTALHAHGLRDLARRRALLPQSTTVSFGFTVRQIVELGRNPWSTSPKEDAHFIDEALIATDVVALQDRPFSALSGGERARASLARVLAQNTPIVLLDEPTAALDLAHQETVLTLARDLAHQGRAVVIVVHDLTLAAAYADTVAIVDNGTVVAHGAPADVLTNEAILRTWKQDVHLLLDPDGNPVVVPRRRSKPHRSRPHGYDATRHAKDTPMTAATADSLSARMRAGSAAEHAAAEHSTFIAALLELRVNAAGYAEYLARYLRVYEALESVGRHLAGDPLAGQLVDAKLDRAEAIKADLAYWFGVAGSTPSDNSPAADAYVAAIEATRTNPARFVAHHYTRYLGDLSGGQVIGAKLARGFGLEDGQGVRFYEFEQIEKTVPYKNDYRMRLDALPVTDAQTEEIVDEVRKVFGLNSAIFDELGANLTTYLR